MTTLTADHLAADVQHACDLVWNGEAVTVTLPRSRNVVLISEPDYRELQRLKDNANYLTKLTTARQELASGKTVAKTLADLDAMAQ